MKTFKIDKKYVPASAIVCLEVCGPLPGSMSNANLWKISLANGTSVLVESWEPVFEELTRYFEIA